MPPSEEDKPTAAPVAENSSGTLILQWLTYAFWGWTVLAMSILTATVLASFIADADTGGFTPYGIAAVLVLLPIAAVCDIFYAKHEQPKKTGASSLIMIIHAVIFALFAIGSLIVAVFSLISLFTNSSDTSGTQVSLYSALIIFVLYAVTFLRTLNPTQLPWLRRYYMIFMIISVGLIAVLGIIGPVANAHKTRDDKLIEISLYDLKRGIEDYAHSNDQLPSTLGSVHFTGDAKKVVDRNLIDYSPNTKPPTATSANTSAAATQQEKTLYYQLCVTYKQASGSRSAYDSTALEPDGYSTYVSEYNHDAGRTCYKLKTTTYADNTLR